MRIWHVGASGAHTMQDMLRLGFKNLMLSAFSHYERNSRMTEWKVGTIRASGGRLFLDSGMISGMAEGSAWSERQGDVAALSRRIRPDYVSALDVPMERHKLASARLTRKEALRITLRNARAFVDADVGGATKVYVIQGWTLEEYLRCLADYRDAGLPNGGGFGIGTCCMRLPTRGLWQIMERLRAETEGEWLHSFGTGDPDKVDRIAGIGVDSVDEGNTVRALYKSPPGRMARIREAYRGYDA